jgi:AraC-like DNA-binding protein
MTTTNDVGASRVPQRADGAVSGGEFRTTDSGAAVRFVDRSYGGAVRIGLADGHDVFRHIRHIGHGFLIDDMTLPGRARVQGRPESGVLIVETLAGQVRYWDGSREVTLDVGNSVLSARSLPAALRTEDVRVRIALVDETLLRRIVAEQLRPISGPITFDGQTPGSDALAQAWARSLRFAHDTVRSTHGESAPLLDEACGRLLAAAVLSAFPNSAQRDPLDEHDGSKPIQLRRAMSFINDSPHDDIGVREIAESVHLSPRAIQYLFRRHLDTTPTEYLRRVRLRGAHQDLLTGNTSTTTVSEIAAKWGFGHTGRFAVQYRQTYGLSPHVTLRQ